MMPEYDYEEMAVAHGYVTREREVMRLVIAARRAFDTFLLPDEEQKALDQALERFAACVPYNDD